MMPLAALVVGWVLTALWPLIGAAGMRHDSGVLFATAGLACSFAGAAWIARLTQETQRRAKAHFVAV